MLPKIYHHFFSSSKEINALCKKHTIYSWSIQSKVNPISISSAKGVYFWDQEGKRYFDMNSQLMCVNIGHGHPKVVQAIKDQADKLCFAGPAFSTQIRAEVGPILAKHMPGDLHKFFFTLGGAEAIENAIKFAKFYTKRSKIIVRQRCYHGATQGAISLTGDHRRWPNEPSMPGVIRISDAYKYRSLFYTPGMSDEEFTEKLLMQLEETLMFENPESVAAIFLEPVPGTNGLIVPPNGYLQGIRRICDKYGILMVCDEVMSGVGRTGAWYAVDHWGVVPDIMTIAKGITSGYLPLGAVAVSAKVAEEFENRMFSGGLTYQAHPMSLAVCKAVMTIMEEEKIVDNSKKMGLVLKKLLEELMEKHPCVGEVRTIGLFGAIEIVKNRKTKEPMTPYAGNSEAMIKIQEFLREKGIFAFSNGHILHTNPPLVVKEEELREAFQVIDQALFITDKYITP